MQNLQTQTQTPAKKPSKADLRAFIYSKPGTQMIEEVITDPKARNNFITNIISSTSLTPALKECTPASLITSALNGFTLGLNPSPTMGEFYMLPFYDSKTRTTHAQFVIGYIGYLQLAWRSGLYKKIHAIEIKEGELIEYDPIWMNYGFKAINDPDERKKAKTIGYFAFYETVSGGRNMVYITKKEMENHANTYSKGYASKKGFTFWEKDFDAMGIKTALRRLLKAAPKSIEMQYAYQHDMEVIDENGNATFADNPNIDYENAIDPEIINGNSVAAEQESDNSLV